MCGAPDGAGGGCQRPVCARRRAATVRGARTATRPSTRAPSRAPPLTWLTKPSVPSLPIIRCLMISMGSSAPKSTSAFRE